jgi:hypothetical protein
MLDVLHRWEVFALFIQKLFGKSHNDRHNKLILPSTNPSAPRVVA